MAKAKEKKPKEKKSKETDIEKATRELRSTASLTAEMVAEAGRLSKAGVPPSLIRQRWSVHPQTWHSWLRRGRAEISDWRDGKAQLGLQSALVHAIESGEVDSFEAILKEGRKISFLERRYRRHFEDMELDQESGELKDPKAAAIAALEKMFSK